MTTGDVNLVEAGRYAGMTEVALPSVRRRSAHWLITLLLVAGALRLASPTGWIGSDDVAYHAAAEHVLVNAPMDRVHHQFARSPIVLMTAAAMWAGGANVAALLLPSFVLSLLTVVVVVEIGTILWNRSVGLTAGTVMAFIPVFVNHSTAVLPGTYTCFFSGVALLLVLVGARRRFAGKLLTCSILAGLFAGAAISTKLFAGGVCVAMAAAVAASTGWSRRWWMAATGAVAGIALFVLLECAFYRYHAGSWFYKFSAMSSARAAHSMGNFHSAAYTDMWSTLQLVWQRMTMTLRPTFSGLGWFGCLLMPAVAWSAFADRRALPLVCWILVTYLGVGFLPISIENGIHVFPPGFFDGVNLMVLCVPASLCVSRLLFAVTAAIPGLGSRVLIRRWPVVLVLVVAVSSWSRWTYGQRTRLPQQELAVAMSQIADRADFRDGESIYVLPSIYWRYRLMFPEKLRERLRVVADADAPDWWKAACPDIEERYVTLPQSPEGYLIATPDQFFGDGHYWDYGVGFPDSVNAWRSIAPTMHVSRQGRVDKMKSESNGRSQSATSASPSDQAIRDAASAVPADPQAARIKALLFVIDGGRSPNALAHR